MFRVTIVIISLPVLGFTSCSGSTLKDPLGIQHDIDQSNQDMDATLRETDSMLHTMTKSDSLLELMDSTYEKR